jgi:hypothetical protein
MRTRLTHSTYRPFARKVTPLVAARRGFDALRSRIEDQAMHPAGGLSAATYAAPRTILGFFGVVLLLVVSGAVTAIGLLAGHKNLDYLIPGIALGAVSFAALEFLTVVFMALRDPTTLMLGQITGPDWLAHRRLMLGDSLSRRCAAEQGSGSG